jgi:hypothetical protein
MVAECKSALKIDESPYAYFEISTGQICVTPSFPVNN